MGDGTIGNMKEFIMKDSLVRIALDWDKGLIDDREARRRADLLDWPVYHRDDTPYGDGGWWEGDEDNTLTAVHALEGTANGIRRGATDRLYDVISHRHDPKRTA